MLKGLYAAHASVSACSVNGIVSCHEAHAKLESTTVDFQNCPFRISAVDEANRRTAQPCKVCQLITSCTACQTGRESLTAAS